MKRQSLEERLVAARGQYEQGLSALDKGRLAEAEANFSRAVQLCPHDYRARRAYADTLWKRGSSQIALEQMRQAISLSGDDVDSMVHMAELLLEGGNISDSLRYANLAIQQDPQAAPGWALRGKALNALGNPHSALDSFHRALSIDRQDHPTRMALAQVYLALGRYKMAHIHLQEVAAAQSLETTHPELAANCLYLQGITLNSLDRPAEAIVRLQQARQLGASPIETSCQMADAYLKQGEQLSALTCLHQAQGYGADPNRLQRLAARIEGQQPDAADSFLSGESLLLR